MEMETLLSGDVADVENLRATLRAANFGEFMSVLLQSERHKNVTLGTLAQQVVPAFLTDQYVLARAVPDRQGAAGTPIGIAFWASVSDGVAERLNGAQEWPVTLAPHEWRSGETIVLLDMIAAPSIQKQIVQKIVEKVGTDKRLMILTADEQGRTKLQDLE